MASPALPLSDVVNVIVQVSPQLAVAPVFNQAIIVGPSTVISQATRVVQYPSLTSMLTAGFTSSSPEYLAAELYFGQNPPPQFLQVGRQDLTAIQTIVPHSGNEGTGYQVGDILTVVQVGGSGGTVKVTTISSGAVTGVSIVTEGTGYTVATALATTGGHGSAAEVDISVVGETALQAVQACRIASPVWWGCMVTDAADADHLAIAAYAQAATPPMMYFLSTADAAVLNNTSGNLCATLQASSYNRVFSLYSTTQGGNAPNNIYAAAAAMGVAMGLNSGLPNSYFTMMFKTAVGVIPEPLTNSQVTTLCGAPGSSLGICCNVYVGYANFYTWLQQGQVANGQFMDEILNLDMLSAAIQYNCVNVLVSNPAVPQTDPGQTMLIHAVNQACQAAAVIGYLGSGSWQGETILNLTNGTALPQGYFVQSPLYATQTPANRALRQAMPIYAAILEGGAAQSLVIGVYVQR